MWQESLAEAIQGVVLMMRGDGKEQRFPQQLRKDDHQEIAFE